MKVHSKVLLSGLVAAGLIWALAVVFLVEVVLLKVQ